jgi:hypothetical protein
MGSQAATTPSLSRASFCRQSSAIRAVCAKERSYGSVRGLRRASSHLKLIHRVSVFAQKIAALAGPFASQKIRVAYRAVRKREIVTASCADDQKRHRQSRNSPRIATKVYAIHRFESRICSIPRSSAESRRYHPLACRRPTEIPFGITINPVNPIPIRVRLRRSYAERRRQRSFARPDNRRQQEWFSPPRPVNSAILWHPNTALRCGSGGMFLADCQLTETK